jgi:cystathionine beta-lyase
MNYDFDRIIDRTGTGSLKWELGRTTHGVDGVLPMWVADMDFEVAPPITEAIIRRANHPVYGYTLWRDSYYDAVTDWMKRRFDWEVQRDWIIFSPGIVPAVNLAVQAFTRPGEKVIIQPPVYYPFANAVLNNGRQLVNNPLVLEGDRYLMDFEQLERVIDRRTRMMILCSPHNPVGRVWTKEELSRLAEICLKHDILLVSDEIHGDLVMRGHRHFPMATVAPELKDRMITCTAPSKTFNLAGLQAANIMIPNEELRERYIVASRNCGVWLGNIFGLEALEAAYRHCEDWLEQLLAYLGENYRFLCGFVEDNLPEVNVLPLEGTYLAWMDFRSLGIDDDELEDLLLKKAKVWLDRGTLFGGPSGGFQRINIACPRPLLREGLDRITAVINRKK